MKKSDNEAFVPGDLWVNTEHEPGRQWFIVITPAWLFASGYHAPIELVSEWASPHVWRSCGWWRAGDASNE